MKGGRAGEDRLIVMVKAPRPGEVKTRLARSIGEGAACEAYRKMVEVLLTRLGALSGVELRFSPDDARSEITPWLRPGWRAVAQGEGDLGRRLGLAAAAAFQEGASRVVLIGSDCPWVTVADIESAWGGLARDEVLLGPARDGGYWLIGLSRDIPELFERIPWSGPEVLEATLERAKGLGLRVSLLRPLSDIDTESEWREWEVLF